MSKGYVYILTNPSMPGLVKIGRTTRTPEARALELHQTGVPTPFKVEEWVYSPDCAELEASVHVDLEECRVDPSREFFLATVEEAKEHLRECHKSQVNEYIDEFLPGYTTIYEPLCIDEMTIGYLAHGSGVNPYDIAAAIRLAEPEDLVRPLERWKERVERIRAEREEKARLS